MSLMVFKKLLFLAASQKFESVDENSEPKVDELFKVASQQIQLEDRFVEPVSLKEFCQIMAVGNS